jgi:hypothetical protein
MPPYLPERDNKQLMNIANWATVWKAIKYEEGCPAKLDETVCFLA